jgi:cytochrome c
MSVFDRSNITRLWRTYHALILAGRISSASVLIKTLVVAGAAVIGLRNSASAQNVAAGENSFKKCLVCHSIGEGATNKIGPVLNGLDGRKAGSVAGFSYSDANKNSGITWNKETFEEYIKNPAGKVPGTKMIFAGIKNEKEIDDLWAYISQFDADGHVKK